MFTLSLLRVRMLLVLLCGVQCLLHGMEIVKKQYSEDDDYHVQHALSLINPKCNKAEEDRYWPQKKHIEKYIEEHKDDLPLLTGARSWNKDFSKCAWVTYEGDVTAYKNLQLTLVGTCGNQIIKQSAAWKRFYFPIFEDNCPFFDEDGHASLYGYGNTKTCFGEYCSFAQYCLDLNGNEFRYCYSLCFCTKPDGSVSDDGKTFAMLLQYPVLLKAFLQSKNVKIVHCCNRHDRVQNFYIPGVTIPENYKLFKKSVELEQMEKTGYAREYVLYSSYDFLHSELRKAIDDQYEKQQAENDNQNLQEK